MTYVLVVCMILLTYGITLKSFGNNFFNSWEGKYFDEFEQEKLKLLLSASICKNTVCKD